MKPIKQLLVASICVLMLVTGCKKEKTTETNNTNNTAITAKYYFQGTINGKTVLFEDGKNNFASGTGEESSTTANGWQIGQYMTLTNVAQTSMLAVSVLKFFPENPDYCSEIESMYKLGSYPFGKYNDSSYPDGVDGVVISYLENGVLWSTDKGPRTQAGSKIEIIEHISSTDGYSKRISKAKFNCTLYDDNGNSMTLTDGEIRSRSVQCMGYINN